MTEKKIQPTRKHKIKVTSTIDTANIRDEWWTEWKTIISVLNKTESQLQKY